MAAIINPIYPIETIGSIDELMAIAAGMEREAAERYEDLANQMDRRDAELAALFRSLAEMEREHESGIGRWAAREGLMPPQPKAFSWRMPETFGEEAGRVLTPYEALGIAVRNEERAFTFYAYLAAMAPDDTVRARAEALAREELSHVSQLRVMRRRAFHMDRPPPRGIRRARNMAEWPSLVLGLEGGSAEVDGVAADILERAGEAEAASMIRAEVQSALRRIHGLSARPGPRSPAAAGARAAGLLEGDTLSRDGALRLSLRNAEEVADAYMATAEHASDETLMREAQAIAQQAIARTAVVRTMLER